MRILQTEKISSPSSCPYIPGQQCRFQYFFATDLSKVEWDALLEKGFRKFGYYFFRPVCDDCRACQPIRIRVNDFKPSRSQRRVIKKNKDTLLSFHPLVYHPDIFHLYQKHSSKRFGDEKTDEREFQSSFFLSGTPGTLSLYHREGMLIGAGFLDISQVALSSVYYVYDPDYSENAPGIFSILAEIFDAKRRGADYYYLGYYVKDCASMAYKNKFKPYEFYDWEQDLWIVSEM